MPALVRPLPSTSSAAIAAKALAATPGTVAASLRLVRRADFGYWRALADWLERCPIDLTTAGTAGSVPSAIDAGAAARSDASTCASTGGHD